MSQCDLWMPLFVGDYLRDTQHLTTELSGAYLHLLMGAWTRGGKLPADDTQLAMISRLSPQAWKKAKPVLAPFFQVSAESWIQKRLLAEFEHAIKVNDAQRGNGKKGGRPRKNKAEPKPVESQQEPAGLNWVSENTAFLKPNQMPIETPSPSPVPLSSDNGAYSGRW